MVYRGVYMYFKKRKILISSFLLLFVLPFAFSEHYNIVSQKPIEEEKVILNEQDILLYSTEDEDDEDDDDVNGDNFFLDQNNFFKEKIEFQIFQKKNLGEKEVFSL